MRERERDKRIVFRVKLRSTSQRNAGLAPADRGGKVVDDLRILGGKKVWETMKNKKRSCIKTGIILSPLDVN